jgi:hypothetical protein
MQHLAGVVDWPGLQATLASRRLLPLLGSRLLAELPDQVPEQFACAVAEASDAARRHGQFLQLAGAHVKAGLSDGGIVSLALKGPGMARLLYGDLASRTSSDIDLLVSAEDLRAAVEVAVGLGYERPSDPVGEDGLPLLHFTLAHPGELLPPVELHWRVHWYERDFARAMLDRSSVGQDGESIASPADGLVSLLLFYARDGFVDVRLLADVVAWWEAFRAQLPHGALDGLAERHPALGRAMMGALLAADRIAGLPARELMTARRRSARVRLAVRLANPNPRQSVVQLHADMALVDGLLTPRGSQREFVRRQLLVSRDVLEYRARRAQREEVGSSFGHGGRVLVRNLLAGARLLRGSGSRPARLQRGRRARH